MSLVRAFTTRRNKPDHLDNIHIGRAASQRQGRPVNRIQISSPVVLLSSTNALSYDAPDIAGTAPIGGSRDFSASSSRSSQEGSDASTFDISSNTDASSIENSPISPEPEPNHLSCYFKQSSPTLQSRASFDAPSIPQRVPSHSKKAHERVHRKRSVQRMMSPPTSIVRNSTEMFKPIEQPQENPFGNELAQLDEVAEELSSAVRDAEAEEDAAYMESHGLARYDADSYLAEIHSLIDETYHAEEPIWI
ncbi:hypothetical protein PRZ48_009204 [Zasmidium cellare]|uniref:Uncharacterized protein n=1 Tax=Zasmidium cellare TaxID=395010 RepID=A0ABR0EB39_ZASCE|nr:hypothetical protein PRZ48_009204 [Zasmidium cellare]